MANCIYAGKEYSDGAEVCQGNVVMRCVEGSWRDTGRTCGEVPAGSVDVTATTARLVPAAATAFCCRFFSVGQITKVGLRNTCADCKVAVINFIFGGGRSEIRKFKVQGKSNIEVDISGTQMTEIIDEEDC